ncbi:MAG: hypothetical protein GY854_17530, partial [Deltaproteobacteria bacterium]|nr:hypothetical protein [Deltaproteobacteria bacterium]
RKRPFVLSAMVLIGYSAARFLFDFIKETPDIISGFPLSNGQVISVPFFALGVWLSVRRSR